MRIGFIALFWMCVAGVPFFSGFQTALLSPEQTSAEKQSTTITADGGVLTVPDGKD